MTDNGPPYFTFKVDVQSTHIEAMLFNALVELCNHQHFVGVDASAKARCARHLAEVYGKEAA